MDSQIREFVLMVMYVGLVFLAIISYQSHLKKWVTIGLVILSYIYLSILVIREFAASFTLSATNMILLLMGGVLTLIIILEVGILPPPRAWVSIWQVRVQRKTPPQEMGLARYEQPPTGGVIQFTHRRLASRDPRIAKGMSPYPPIITRSPIEPEE